MIQTATAPLNETALPGIEIYDSREAYQVKTGHPAPLFDPAKPRKYWRDTTPAGNRPKKVYLRTLMRYNDGTPVIEDGQPVFEPISMTPAEAATVNIPSEEDDIRAQNLPDQYGYKTPPVPVPLRELEGDEYYFLAPGFTRVVMVGRRALVEAERQQDPLVRIEQKIDQLLANVRR